jgi:dsDNA-specific endonuclease/ATPase MutS2
MDPWDDELEPVEIPITDVLDLHTFRPAEVADVVAAYIEAAREKGLRELRIIHGKGTGTQRRIVRSILEREPAVRSFGDAPGGAGGWGATCVTLEDPEDPS